ncbi:DotG/IcmE/VirB10 family protein [Agrobacterium sp. GD03638]|jgi:intracellular multiplication protein IcmE|uniref:DotG/IcmE/VirB10 family protein n=1 Tax=Agrobacterium sp. GD03638 TaxID=2975353 RepID=UPI002448B5B4|nr:DotG/IcmE/VirB10 family protein [Agrobacterium sp. GD03638]MCW5679546.1 DotG/IcmE/VirB10 family protein [Xanthobacteraceae bacterium]MCW5796331.1 DotG/IcmE/VirB10 family protein [Nitrospira sp.]MCW5886537.1 DotG/IcmE/VirB10 family protein [Anaerolineales bacterium]MDH2221614.1 DotG/IcmE/VirB10 family protein [Agrobacterium sp. GD03638]
MNKLVLGAAGALVMAIGAGAFMLSGATAPDRGAGTTSNLPNGENVPQNDQMTPVDTNEANRRATVNNEDAQVARETGKDYQAPTVITGIGPADKGEEPTVVEEKKADPEERIIKETTERTVYVTKIPVQQPVSDQAARAAIQAQIDALARGSSGNGGNTPRVQMAMQKYKAPPEVKDDKQTGPATRPQQKMTMLARTGDVIFARLDRSFNSDDPGAPIIVSLDDVIYDPARGTRNGPLTGMRLVGQISYSDNQAAISFTQIVTNTGAQFPVTAIAVSESQARTGIAADVDKHTLQRYSGLFLSSIIQGVGQVGQQLVQNNRNIAVSDGVIVSGRNPVNYGEAALAALQPLGQSLSQAAAKNFSRPPTMSAPAGMGLGVVFLAPVVIPQGVR